jgi:hypothetical protein
MGKTVPSYRCVIEDELKRLKDMLVFPSQADEAAFEEIADMCRMNAMAGSNACNPVLLEPMVISILLGQKHRLIKLEREIKELSNEDNALLEKYF